MKFAPKRENPVQVQIIDIAIAGVLGGCPLNKRILLSKCYACGNRFRIAFAIQNLFPPTAEASAPLWWLLVQHAPFLFFFFDSLTEPRGVHYHPMACAVSSKRLYSASVSRTLTCLFLILFSFIIIPSFPASFSFLTNQFYFLCLIERRKPAFQQHRISSR